MKARLPVYVVVHPKSRAVSCGYSPDGEPLRVYSDGRQADVAAQRLGMKVEPATLVRRAARRKQ